MTETHHFPYGGANHRLVRAYIGIALTAILGMAAGVWWAIRFLGYLVAGQITPSLALDSIVLMGLGVYLLWTAYLSLCNVFVTTASISLLADHVELVTMRGRMTRVSMDDIHTNDAFDVNYRLGAGRSLFKMRQRLASATFVPVDQLSGHSSIFRTVARMYAGRSACCGFLITPDHADYQHLLDQLSIKQGASHE